MNRAASWGALANSGESNPWDVLIIGGGSTGLGAAIEASARGLRTALVEQSDFCKATSSRSTKLIHGGVRYLGQGQIGLVRESLRERGRLVQNAPHLVKPLRFIVPTFSGWQTFYYGCGLRLYDLLAGKYSLGPVAIRGRKEVASRISTLNQDRLRGGVEYVDAQFDDARMAVCMARTCADLGGVPVNYVRVNSLLRSGGRVIGAGVIDCETGAAAEVRARVVINATGIFTDDIRRMDDASTPPMMTVSQGIHLVLPERFLPGSTALMIPKTDDGRVLFAIPWHGRVLLGTTDTPVESPILEPQPFDREVDYLLDHGARYLAEKPALSDVLSQFAGLRPLVKQGSSRHTSKLARTHRIEVAPSGLITIAGGKWTTWRQMAQDTIDRAVAASGLSAPSSRTENLRLHGAPGEPPPAGDDPCGYGSDAVLLNRFIEEKQDLAGLLHPGLPYRRADVIWSVRHEAARTLEDVLARRTRALFLDARASIEIAPVAAQLMADELQREPSWREEQVRDFTALAAGYLPSPRPSL